MPLAKPVLVVGDLNADLILTGLSGPPRSGREVIAQGRSLTVGGSAALFACGLARLGRRVRFAGRIGKDDLGQTVSRMMGERGVDLTRLISDPKTATGLAVALSGPHDRAFVSCLGSVATTRARDLTLGSYGGYGHLHLTSPFLQESLRPDFPRILRRAKKAGLTTSLDPGWDPQEEWDLEAVYPWTDILLLNEVEAAALTGLRRPAAAARELAFAVRLAVVKTGPEGAVAHSGGQEWRALSYPVRVVDTTGAGDTFDAGFIDQFLNRRPLDEALAFACACGAQSTRVPGGYEGQPTKAQARRLMSVPR
jgi:sugar/nucleoside kinase (ribokinase family)